MNQFPVTYWNCIDLRSITKDERIQLYYVLKRAVETYGPYDAFTYHRKRNLERVAAWLRDRDGIKI